MVIFDYDRDRVSESEKYEEESDTEKSGNNRYMIEKYT